MSIVIDLIVVAIIGICIFTSSREGFIKALIELVGFILAVILATSISTPLAESTYTKTVENTLVEKINAIEFDSDANQIVTEVLDNMPDFIVKYADEMLGFSEEKFTQSISENLTEGASNAVKIALQDTIKPIFVKLLELLYTVVILSVLTIVVGIIAKLLNGLFSIGIVNKINRLLGAILGLPKGIIIAIIFCVIISFVVTLGSGFWIFTPENINKTLLFKLFAKVISIKEIIPVSDILPV